MKRILLICPKFFGYQERICTEFSELGWEVDTFDDRFEAGVVRKSLLRYARKFGLFFFRSENADLRKRIKTNKYDHVFVIIGEGLEAQTFQAVAQTGTSVFYTWDSTQNKSYLPSVFRMVESYTFDPKDAKTFGIKYLPLFWKASASRKSASKAYDFSFIGSIHSNRIPVVATLLKGKPSAKTFVYFYSPTVLHVLLALLKYPSHVFAMRKNIHFKALGYDTYVETCQASEFIVDVAHPAQIGATMRSLEVLGMGGKIITNNPELARLFPDLKDDIDVLEGAKALEPAELAPPVVTDLDDLEIRKWVEILTTVGEG